MASRNLWRHWPDARITQTMSWPSAIGSRLHASAKVWPVESLTAVVVLEAPVASIRVVSVMEEMTCWQQILITWGKHLEQYQCWGQIQNKLILVMLRSSSEPDLRD